MKSRGVKPSQKGDQEEEGVHQVSSLLGPDFIPDFFYAVILPDNTPDATKEKVEHYR